MENQVKRMPIGVQDFERLREDGYMYVDKTMYIQKLLAGSPQYFLSRPRRFGKSLFLSTLKYYFLGKRELFDGLYIFEVEKNWTKYPVFHIEFNIEGYNSIESLYSALNSNLIKLEDAWGKDNREDSPATRFRGLIQRAAEKTGKQVVVLVDEYDKPLLSTMHDEKLNEQMRTLLKGFYGVLKAEDANLKFVFLTGVTKFSQVSIFSDLNHLNDISMDNQYSGICGISENELLNQFQPEIQTLADNLKISYERAVAELKKNYDGYHFSKQSEDMYNPFSVLNTFEKKDIDNYWFKTGTPTFLVKMIQDFNLDITKLEDNTPIATQSIMDYRTDNKNPLPVLYQSGYLTIKGFDKMFDEYILGFPNEEVKYGFLNELVPFYLSPASEFDSRMFCRDLLADNVAQFMLRLQTFFSAIPFELKNKAERHYQTVFYLLFNLMGQFIKVEDHSAIGSADAVIILPNHIYIFEFKLSENATAEDALAQIETKNYAAKYALSGIAITKIGVEFDNEKRTVKRWLIK